MDLNDEEDETDAFGSRPPRQEVNDQRKAVETFTSQTLAAMKFDLFLHFLSFSLFLPLMKKIIGLFKNGLDEIPGRQTLSFLDFLLFFVSIFCVAIRPIDMFSLLLLHSSPTIIFVSFLLPLSVIFVFLPPEFR
jgi:hypothetical protein